MCYAVHRYRAGDIFVNNLACDLNTKYRVVLVWAITATAHLARCGPDLRTQASEATQAFFLSVRFDHYSRRDMGAREHASLQLELWGQHSQNLSTPIRLGWRHPTLLTWCVGSRSVATPTLGFMLQPNV